MKRTRESRKNLPPIRCNLADLESLIYSIAATFQSDKVSTSISVNLPGQQLDFSTFEEIRQVTDLPASISAVSIHMSSNVAGDQRKVHFMNHPGWDKSSITATGPHEAWCAGVVDIASGFAQRHRLRYTIASRWAFLVMAWVVGFAPAMLSGSGVVPNMTWATTGAFIAVSLVFSVVFFAYAKLFPALTIIIRREEGWWKQRNAELTLVLTALATLAAIVSALISYFK